MDPVGVDHDEPEELFLKVLREHKVLDPEGQPLADDYCFYVNRRDDWLSAAIKPLLPGTRTLTPYGCPISLRSAGIRLQVASAYGGGYWSVTLRGPGTPSADDVSVMRLNLLEKSQFKPSGNCFYRGELHLFSIRQYVEQVFCRLFEQEPSSPRCSVPSDGLILVAGATKSKKSQIARGLVHRYLCQLSASSVPQRVPHLVTFEDPIEKSFWPGAAIQESNPLLLFDYCPREAETDAESLEQALSDALRQTPAVFFAGETRRKEHWGPILDFAGTGHLVVTTTHAGSLVEAVGKLFEAVKAESPAGRAEVVARLRGVVHLKALQVRLGSRSGSTPEIASYLVPAVWRRSGNGALALVSDGLSALLPNCPASEAEVSSFGRQFFAREMLRDLPDRAAAVAAAKDDFEDFRKAYPGLELHWPDLAGGPSEFTLPCVTNESTQLLARERIVKRHADLSSAIDMLDGFRRTNASNRSRLVSAARKSDLEGI